MAHTDTKGTEKMKLSNLKVDKAEFNGKYTDIVLRSEDNNVRLYLKGNYVDFLVKDLKGDKEYTLTLSDLAKSENALHYAWGLINRIANLLQTSKEEIYDVLLKRYSQSEILTIEAGEYKPSDYGHHEVVIPHIEGKTILKVYKGISEMDAHELNIFIEGVKSECQEMGINTDTPSEEALYGT